MAKLNRNRKRPTSKSRSVGSPKAKCRKDMCPLCKRKKHDKKYRRDMGERRKALKNAAKEFPQSGISKSARDFIVKHDGYLVPKGYEVSHKKPLYLKPNAKRCILDKAKNMETIKKSEHRKSHKRSGYQFHKYNR